MKPKSMCEQESWKAILGTASMLLPVVASVSAGPYRPVEALPGGIVDMHCHVAGIGAGGSGCFVSARLRNSWRFHIYLRSFGVSRKALEAHGDGLSADRIAAMLSQSRYVSKAVVLAMDGVIGS